MSANEITDLSSETTEETAIAGSSEATEERASQEKLAVESRVVEIEAERTKLTEERSSLQTELEAAKKRAEDLDRNLKAHQRNATAKLQEASDLRRQVTNQESLKFELKAELAQQRTMLNRLAQVMLEEDQQKQLALDMRESQLQWQQSQLQSTMQAQQQMQVPQEPSEIDIERYKSELFQTYASDSTIDYNDPRIDWAGDVNIQQQGIAPWLMRFRGSVNKIEREKVDESQKALIASIQQQNAEQFKALQEEAKLAKTEASKATEEAATQARNETLKQEEDRLRKKGVDAGATLSSDGTRKLQSELEEIDDSLLYSKNPADRRKYDEQLKAVRNKIYGSR